MVSRLLKCYIKKLDPLYRLALGQLLEHARDRGLDDVAVPPDGEDVHYLVHGRLAVALYPHQERDRVQLEVPPGGLVRELVRVAELLPLEVRPYSQIFSETVEKERAAGREVRDFVKSLEASKCGSSGHQQVQEIVDELCPEPPVKNRLTEYFRKHSIL